MLYYNSNVIDQKVSHDNDYSLINNDVINFDHDVSFSFNGEDTNWSNILDKLSSDTKLTINRLDLNGAWSRALTMLGAQACFFPVSSIGKDLQVIIIPYYADAANPAQQSQPTQPSQSAQPVYNNSEYLAPMEAINTSMNEEVFTPQKSIDVPTEPKEVLTERGLVKSTDRRNPNRGGSGNIHNNTTIPQSAPPPQPAPADSTPQRQLRYKKCLVKTEIAQKFNELSFDEKIVYGKELLDTMDSNINSQLEYKNWNENISPYFNPRNIELPLLFMLMKFNVIPNILEGDFVSAEQESRDKAFKTWIRNYGWRDATTPKKSTHTDPVPVPPKNWLDKLIDKIVDFFSSLFGK